MTSKASTRIRIAYSCTECGHQAAKWVGRCPECQAWGSLTESAAGPARGSMRAVNAGPVSTPARPIATIDATIARPRPSGVTELDRVLGGGLVPGSVVLLAGEPGVGKSTLLLSAAQTWAASGQGPVLIVTGEESAGQVRLRAQRMNALHEQVYLAAETELSAVLGHVDAVTPELLIIDSVQTIASADIDSSPGSVSQVRAVAGALTAVAKQRGIACVLVGHVTKDGAIAGPRTLEHLVDVVLHFEGDRHSSLRLVRGVKNRFGASDEVGCFRMTTNGIEEVLEPSEVFVSGDRPLVPGSAVSIALQGRRPLPIEIQALVTRTGGEGSRRTVSGLDSGRVAMALAVLNRFGGVALGGAEVIAATTGGVAVTEPAVDLALAMAVWSSVRDIVLPQQTVFIGELGLSADIRPVPALGRRLAEAARLGFTRAVVPAGGDPDVSAPRGLQVTRVRDLGSALRTVGSDEGVVRWLQR